MGDALEEDVGMNARKPPSICFFGFDEQDEGGRAWAIRTGLAVNGVRIHRCQTRVVGFLAKYRDLYKKWKLISEPVDAIYVIFMGYHLMPLAWVLARRRGIPVILDALVSQYDTEVSDRKRLSRFNPRAWFLWMVDWFSCHMADAIVVDTRAHKRFFAQRFFVRQENIIIVPVGCRSDLFVPMPHTKSKEQCIVEFHGGMTPLQGVEYILEAAKILQDGNEPIHFEIIGVRTGSPIISLAEKLSLRNVTFFGRQSLKELPHIIARADICLGIFGATEKALRVIPNKVYECLSCGKAVITERSPAALVLLHDREDVYMVEPGNATDLATAIVALHNDSELRGRLEQHARAFSLREFSPGVIVTNLVDWLHARS